jgi:hypothetical protein
MHRPAAGTAQVDQNAGERVMRIVHWLCLVSMALFVSGIGFIVAGARTARQARGATSTAPATFTPVATVKQIMKGIVDPAATVVFDAVSTTVSLTGTEEKAPESDEEWETVGNSAAALIESGNLLMFGGRAVDTDDWMKMSRAMIESGTLALTAVQARDASGVFAAGEAVYKSCDDCHRKYQRGS